jgi:hypothetical protein
MFGGEFADLGVAFRSVEIGRRIVLECAGIGVLEGLGSDDRESWWIEGCGVLKGGHVVCICHKGASAD